MNIKTLLLLCILFFQCFSATKTLAQILPKTFYFEIRVKMRVEGKITEARVSVDREQDLVDVVVGDFGKLPSWIYSSGHMAEFILIIEKIRCDPYTAPVDGIHAILENSKLITSDIYDEMKIKYKTVKSNTGYYDKDLNDICVKQGLDMYLSEYTGLHYIICVDGRNNVPKIIINRNIIATIDNFQGHWVNLDVQLAKECPKTPAKAIVEPPRMPWFLDTVSCDFDWLRDESTCPPTPKYERDCIFIHGAGGIGDHPYSHDYQDYWGLVKRYIPRCREHYFIHYDGKYYKWDDDHLMEAFCKLSTINQKVGDTEIKNKFVYTHSMGNLLAVAALHYGRCSIGENTTIYGMGAPLMGAPMVKELRDACNATYHGEFHWLKNFIASFLDYCDGEKAKPGYDCLGEDYEGYFKFSTTELAGKIFKKLGCGNQPWGLDTSYSFILWGFQSEAHFDMRPNDGEVVCDKSCDLVDPKITQYYSINHADETCRNGNGFWGADRQACDYWAMLY